MLPVDYTTRDLAKSSSCLFTPSFSPQSHIDIVRCLLGKLVYLYQDVRLGMSLTTGKRCGADSVDLCRRPKVGAVGIVHVRRGL
jgi:hypothetical protein